MSAPSRRIVKGTGVSPTPSRACTTRAPGPTLGMRTLPSGNVDDDVRVEGVFLGGGRRPALQRGEPHEALVAHFDVVVAQHGVERLEALEGRRRRA